MSTTTSTTTTRTVLQIAAHGAIRKMPSEATHMDKSKLLATFHKNARFLLPFRILKISQQIDNHLLRRYKVHLYTSLQLPSRILLTFHDVKCFFSYSRSSCDVVQQWTKSSTCKLECHDMIQTFWNQIFGIFGYITHLSP